ncbi:MAG: NAD(P)/FAD-dependent oxidoreductase [Candidatus Thorarchaeota archaeon]
MSESADIVIIGAGPAGLAAARVMNERCAEALLISKERSPGETKVCGGFVPTRALRSFGVQPNDKMYPIRNIRIRFPGQEAHTVHFDRVVGYNVSRGDLGSTLLDWAGKGTCEVRLNTIVSRVVEYHDRCEVICQTDESTYTVKTRVLIDASGVSPISVRSGQVRRRLEDDQVGYAIQSEMEFTSDSQIEATNTFLYGHEFSPGAYAWIFPRRREVVIGTGGIVQRVKRQRADMKNYLDRVVQYSRTLAGEYVQTGLVKTRAALVPLAGIVRPSFSRHILLAGDAGAHCSPITGEGIYYSMVAGGLAGMVASDAVRSERPVHLLRNYEKLWIRAIGSDLRWGLRLQKLLARPGSGMTHTRSLSSEKARRTIAEMLVGDRSVSSTLLRVAPGYLCSRVFR